MQKKMMATIGIIVGCAGIFGLVIWSMSLGIEPPEPPLNYDQKTIAEMAGELDFGGYNVDSVIGGDETTGGIGDKVEGDVKNARVVLYEYADYSCGHCAEWNRLIEELLAENEGKLALVFRGFSLGFTNSVRAIAAANAAGQQGYWREYKNLLFEKQAEWAKLEETKIQAKLNSYFKQASGGKGDMEQFRKDMRSEAVKKRVAFDYGLGEKAGVRGTPTFRLDGKNLELKDVQKVLAEKLK